MASHYLFSYWNANTSTVIQMSKSTTIHFQVFKIKGVFLASLSLIISKLNYYNSLHYCINSSPVKNDNKLKIVKLNQFQIGKSLAILQIFFINCFDFL